jgi:menaquinone-dependent protoporphyrinogen IX oxidase
MQLNRRPFVRVAIACILSVVFFIPTDLVAQSHVVSPADLQREVMAASLARQHHLETVRQFLSTPIAEKAMKSAQVDPQQVKAAVSTLDDKELAEIAARADKAQAEFAAGALGERDLIWIILAIVVLVLIIVAVR